MKRRDLTGNRYGRLVVIGPGPKTVSGRTAWRCLCDCGQEASIALSALHGGLTKSCGCFRREHSKSMNQSHGRSQTSEYHVWAGVVQRCNNPKNQAFHNYGGRGIRVCEQWATFEGFYADMGASNGLTLERMNNDGNYEPANCKWATRKEQNSNRRDNVFLEHAGLRLTLTQWSEKMHIALGTIQKRLKLGWSTRDTLEAAVRPPRY